MAAKGFKRISRAELVNRRLKAADPKEIYAGLLTVAKTRNFKHAWVRCNFKAIFGKWPKPDSIVEPGPACSDLLVWLERERRNWGARMGRERDKQRELTKAQSALILDRLEAILAELEANPLVLEPACQEDTDCEALDLAHGLEQRMRANLNPVPGDTNAT